MSRAREQSVTSRVGAHIKSVRESLDMTQEELANKSNISRLQVYRIESGISIPQLKTLEAFADVLEMEL